MTWFLLAGWLGALPGSGPPLIATPEQAESLCHELLERPAPSELPGDPVDRAAAERGWPARRDAALQKAYAVEIPPGLFRFAEYDAEAEELRLDDRWALLGAGGGLAILPRADEPWALSATPAQAHEAYRRWRRGGVRLFVTFSPAGHGCNGAPYARNHTLAVTPGSLLLRARDGSFTLAGAGDWAPPAGAPALRVEPPVVAAGDADVSAVERSIEGDAGLRACYAHALSSAPEAGGDLVIEAEIGPPGVVQTCRVALDGVGVPSLVDCLRKRFEALTLRGAGAGAHLYVPLELGGR